MKCSKISAQREKGFWLESTCYWMGTILEWLLWVWFSELLSWPWGHEGCSGYPWIDGGVGKSVQERTHENHVKTSDNQIEEAGSTQSSNGRGRGGRGCCFKLVSGSDSSTFLLLPSSNCLVFSYLQSLLFSLFLLPNARTTFSLLLLTFYPGLLLWVQLECWKRTPPLNNNNKYK